MATESVKILIEAEDQATAALRKATTEQEKSAAKAAVVKARAAKLIEIERVELAEGAEAAHAFALELQGVESAEAALIARDKELLNQQRKRNAEMAKTPDGFKNTKASTEFFGSIASLAGGGEIGSAASQLAGLTEKTAQFNQVAAQGGAAALAFKGGLVVAAAAIGIQIGQAIGNVVFETDRWNGELETAVASLKKLESVKLNQMQDSFANFKIDEIELNPAGADAAAKDRLELIHTEISALEDRKKTTKSSLDAMKQSGSIDFGNTVSNIGQMQEIGEYLISFTGEHKAMLAEKQRNVEEDEASLAVLRQQQTELENLLTIEKEREDKRQVIAGDTYIQGLKDQLAGLNAELDGTSNQLQALINTANGDQNFQAVDLLDEIDAAKKKIAAEEKERQLKEQAAEKEKQAAITLQEFKKRELEKLEEERILLEKGKEAAHAFRLEKQGLSKDEAARIAATQAEVDAINDERNKKKDGKIQPLQAQESRLLTRGPEQDKTAENTKKIADLSKAQLDKLDGIYKKLAEPAKSSSGTTLEVLSK